MKSEYAPYRIWNSRRHRNASNGAGNLGWPASRLFLAMTLVLVLTASVGCTHQMRVLNLDAYKVAPTEGPPIDVAVAEFRGSADESFYFQAVVSALRSHPHVRTVRTNWRSQSAQEGFNPDHLVSIRVEPRYKGSGANFPITFPGFLIFVCAWNGYVYNADITTKVTVASLAEAESVPEQSSTQPAGQTQDIQTTFDIRHCDFERGFWSGTGWWFPGWGLHNIVTGIVFINYDSDSTQPFHEKVDPTYGAYVAEKIVRMLTGTGGAE
jgi:hypothetical protein